MKLKRKTQDIINEGFGYKDVTSDKHSPEKAKRVTVQLIVTLWKNLRCSSSLVNTRQHLKMSLFEDISNK